MQHQKGSYGVNNLLHLHLSIHHSTHGESIITGSSIINSVTDTDITIIQSAALAGFASVAQVAERLARSSLDGKLTAAEINEAFAGKPK